MSEDLKNKSLVFPSFDGDAGFDLKDLYKKQGLRLIETIEGAIYVYDPKTGELFVLSDPKTKEPTNG